MGDYELVMHWVWRAFIGVRQICRSAHHANMLWYHTCYRLDILFLQGGTVGALAMGILYAFQEKLVSTIFQQKLAIHGCDRSL
jgi:hypothetical protein